MVIQPVSKCKKADYPTQTELKSHPEARQRMPVRWAANPKIAATIAIAGAAFQNGWTLEHPITPGINVPRYMTETDAMSIVQEQARKYGLSFKDNEKAIRIPITTSTGATKQVDFILELYDEKTGIGFECVSEYDCFDIFGTETKVTPNQLAQIIRNSLSPADRAKTKIITEPYRGEKVGRKKEEALLRTEIQSFFGWLKKQGVI